jgi:hypothetical protein
MLRLRVCGDGNLKRLFSWLSSDFERGVKRLLWAIEWVSRIED